MPPIKTALVHDWLTNRGGAERFLESVYTLYPSPIHVLVKNESCLEESLLPREAAIHTSFLQKMPLSAKGYRYYLPLFPLAIEQFDLSGFDLILSSSHAVAKNVLTHAQQLHICYCHTPMRYAWDLYHSYLKEMTGFKRKMAQVVLHYIRSWDSASSGRVDHFIANSHYVARRIQKVYHRKADVIYSGVATHLFSLAPQKENFYLTVSRLVPYKRIDLIVEAFAHMPEKRLIVIGEGPEMKKIKQKATQNVELLGSLSDTEVRSYMARARAFIFAAEEDFGLTPVEAQAAGTPVIAFGRGGALETVQEHMTGLFFHKQEISSLVEALLAFEKKEDTFDAGLIKQHAEQFSEGRFRENFRNYVETKVAEFYESSHPCRG